MSVLQFGYRIQKTCQSAISKSPSLAHTHRNTFKASDYSIFIEHLFQAMFQIFAVNEVENITAHTFPWGLGHIQTINRHNGTYYAENLNRMSLSGHCRLGERDLWGETVEVEIGAMPRLFPICTYHWIYPAEKHTTMLRNHIWKPWPWKSKRPLTLWWLCYIFLVHFLLISSNLQYLLFSLSRGPCFLFHWTKKSNQKRCSLHTHCHLYPFMLFFLLLLWINLLGSYIRLSSLYFCTRFFVLWLTLRCFPSSTLVSPTSSAFPSLWSIPSAFQPAWAWKLLPVTHRNEKSLYDDKVHPNPAWTLLWPILFSHPAPRTRHNMIPPQGLCTSDFFSALTFL